MKVEVKDWCGERRFLFCFQEPFSTLGRWDGSMTSEEAIEFAFRLMHAMNKEELDTVIKKTLDHLHKELEEPIP